ncbi:exported hypothetical protein [Candidatus Magnetomoraceae bacterium gMMP-15]
MKKKQRFRLGILSVLGLFIVMGLAAQAVAQVFDVNNDGKTGVPEAIYSLKTAAGIIVDYDRPMPDGYNTFIMGVVVDDAGKPVVGARVLVGDIETKTNEGGQYLLKGVPIYMEPQQSRSIELSNSSLDKMITVSVLPPENTDLTSALIQVSTKMITISQSCDQLQEWYAQWHDQYYPNEDYPNEDWDYPNGEGSGNSVILNLNDLCCGQEDCEDQIFITADVDFCVLPHKAATVKGIVRNESTGEAIVGTLVSARFVAVNLDTLVAPGVIPAEELEGLQFNWITETPLVQFETNELGGFELSGLLTSSEYVIEVDGYSGASDCGSDNEGPCNRPAVYMNTSPYNGGSYVLNAGNIYVSLITSNDGVEPTLNLTTTIGGISYTGVPIPEHYGSGSMVVYSNSVDGTAGNEFQISFSEEIAQHAADALTTESVSLIKMADGSAIEVTRVFMDGKTLKIQTTEPVEKNTPLEIKLKRAHFIDGAGNQLAFSEGMAESYTSITGMYLVLNASTDIDESIYINDEEPPTIIKDFSLTPYVGFFNAEFEKTLVVYAKGIDGTTGKEFVIKFSEPLQENIADLNSVVLYSLTESRALALDSVNIVGDTLNITTQEAIPNDSVLEFRLKRSDFLDPAGNMIIRSRAVPCPTENDNCTPVCETGECSPEEEYSEGNIYLVLNACTDFSALVGPGDEKAPTLVRNHNITPYTKIYDSEQERYMVVFANGIDGVNKAFELNFSEILNEEAVSIDSVSMYSLSDSITIGISQVELSGNTLKIITESEVPKDNILDIILKRSDFVDLSGNMLIKSRAEECPPGEVCTPECVDQECAPEEVYSENTISLILHARTDFEKPVIGDEVEPTIIMNHELTPYTIYDDVINDEVLVYADGIYGHDREFEINFSEVLNKDIVNNDSVFLRDEDTDLPIAIEEVTLDGNTLRIKTAADLSKDTSFTIRLKRVDFTDLAGNRIDNSDLTVDHLDSEFHDMYLIINVSTERDSQSHFDREDPVIDFEGNEDISNLGVEKPDCCTLMVYKDGIDGTAGKEFTLKFSEPLKDNIITLDSLILYSISDGSLITVTGVELIADTLKITTEALDTDTVFEIRLKRSDFVDLVDKQIVDNDEYEEDRYKFQMQYLAICASTYFNVTDYDDNDENPELEIEACDFAPVQTTVEVDDEDKQVIVYDDGIDGTDGNAFEVKFNEPLQDVDTLPVGAVILYDVTNNKVIEEGITASISENTLKITTDEDIEGVFEIRLKRDAFVDPYGNALSQVESDETNDLIHNVSIEEDPEGESSYLVLNASTYFEVIPKLDLEPLPNVAQDKGENVDLVGEPTPYSNPAFNSVIDYERGAGNSIFNLNAANANIEDLLLLAQAIDRPADNNSPSAINPNVAQISFIPDDEIAGYDITAMDAEGNEIPNTDIQEQDPTDDGKKVYHVDLGRRFAEGDHVVVHTINDFGDRGKVVEVPLKDNTPITTVINNCKFDNNLTVDVAAGSAPEGCGGNLVDFGKEGTGSGLPYLYARADMYELNHAEKDGKLDELTSDDTNNVYTKEDFEKFSRARKFAIQISEPPAENDVLSVTKAYKENGDPADMNITGAEYLYLNPDSNPAGTENAHIIATSVDDILKLQNVDKISLDGLLDAAGAEAVAGGASAADVAANDMAAVKVFDAMPPLMTSANVYGISVVCEFTEAIQLTRGDGTGIDPFMILGSYEFKSDDDGNVFVMFNGDYTDHKQKVLSWSYVKAAKVEFSDSGKKVTITLPDNAPDADGGADLSHFFTEVYAKDDTTYARRKVNFSWIRDRSENVSGTDNNAWENAADNINSVPNFAAVDSVAPSIAPDNNNVINPKADADDRYYLDVMDKYDIALNTNNTDANAADSAINAYTNAVALDDAVADANGISEDKATALSDANGISEDKATAVSDANDLSQSKNTAVSAADNYSVFTKGQLDSATPGTQAYTDALATYNSAVQSYSNAVQEYNTAVDEYNTAVGEYNTAVGEYNTAVGEYNSAKALADADTPTDQLNNTQKDECEKAIENWLVGYEVDRETNIEISIKFREPIALNNASLEFTGTGYSETSVELDPSDNTMLIVKFVLAASNEVKQGDAVTIKGIQDLNTPANPLGDLTITLGDSQAGIVLSPDTVY